MYRNRRPGTVRDCRSTSFCTRMADDFGALAVCVILSGTGADGSLGLKAVKENGGLVIAQKPEEAGYDGMPRSAILTGMVDFVLPVAEIADALSDHVRQNAIARAQGDTTRTATEPNWLSEIIDLLRAKTDHDFTLYKKGTLQRRIERRMAMSSIEPSGMKRYLEVLRGDSERARSPGQGPTHQCNELFSRPGSLQVPSGHNDTRIDPRPSRRSAAARLDRRLQHRRRDVLACHALP